MNAYRIMLSGQLQGVGFRPHVWRQAQKYAVHGDVANYSGGVSIFAQDGDVEAFIRAVCDEMPGLAKVDQVDVNPAEYRAGLKTFSILQSVTDTLSSDVVKIQVTPDVVTCEECRAEIRQPGERRYRYPFANCTQCGPRFSIIHAVPYDRHTTTMRPFSMCSSCLAEYEDPGDRRFHAQPIACPECGPQICFEQGAGQSSAFGDQAMAEAVDALRAGQIVAIKGLGGFHLACDAMNEKSVSLLRNRKRRPDKPFALMAGDVETIAQFVKVNEQERSILESPAGPIVLLEADGQSLAPSVAPDQWSLGWMLPTTPLHILLLDCFKGPLVMTSGNLSGEPQVIENEEARKKLSTFADGFLMHDRDIARRLDDSVVRVVDGQASIQRRARGYAPSLISLPKGFEASPPVAAYGAFLKAALCLTRDGSALLSHHLGDLDDDLTAREYAKADEDYAALLNHRPAVVACDAHPDYPSTHAAQVKAEALSIPLIQVQHHHAHIAAVMAENAWRPEDGPVLGVAMDGLGYGEDDTVWGGEWILAQYDGFERLAHLKPVPLPGGNAAQREPWRNLMAQLDACGEEDVVEALFPDKPVSMLRAAVSRGINAPLTSSCGRLFDAFAALIGIAHDHQTFEGQAAMSLETMARKVGAQSGYDFEFGPDFIDPAPMWRQALTDLADNTPAPIMAARFQTGLAETIAATARQLQIQTGAKAIALSGGCFQNATLLTVCLERLHDCTVLTHSEVPANDGGIAFGQAVVAAKKSESI